MRLSDEEYEFIKGEVGHLFKQLNVKCVPVSGFEIASKLGITLIPYTSLREEKLEAAMKVSEDGFYCEENGKECIYYNNSSDRNYERQNMTILHEIGHCVLDHLGHSQKEEAEASFFAAYAIAPPVLIQKVAPKSFYDVYEKFHISLEAAYNAFVRYQKWERHHNWMGTYYDYEISIIEQYEKSMSAA